MRRNFWELLITSVVGSFFIFSTVFSANTDVVINEIGAFPTSTHEWIEIWNKGAEPVDLLGWTFWENSTRHGLTAIAPGDSILAPGEYGAIAQKSEQFLLDHPGFGGSIFGSSWSSLSTSGEEIGLDDAGGTSVERFVYQPAARFSLERKDPFLAEYGASNWQEHVSGNTLGFVNSNFIPAAGGTPPETAPTSTPTSSTTTLDVPPATTPASTTTSTPVVADLSVWNFVKINEFVPNPESGSEWVEIYNASSSTIDLAGGILCDNRASSCTIATLEGAILPHGFVVVFLPSGKLNNDGDSVIVKNPSGGVVDSIVYGAGLLPAKGQAVARRSDGVDTNSDGDVAITTILTPGSANVITAPSAPQAAQPTGGSGGSAASNTGNATAQLSFFELNKLWTTVSSSIVINELLPNPAGSDDEDEFVELKNISASTIMLSGWQLGTKEKLFTLFGEIAGGAVRAFGRAETGIVLPNTTSTEVRLYTPEHQIADSKTYVEAPSGQSYARDTSGNMQWTAVVTRGIENEVRVLDTVRPIWKTNVPTRGKPGEALRFSAGATVDPRGGSFLYSWNFGEGNNLDGGEVEHAFMNPGKYSVSVSATSSAGTVGRKDFTVRITAMPTTTRTVVISEVFSDPAGADSTEFVELFNASATTTDLSGYTIETETGDAFTIPPATRMEAGQFLVFYHPATQLNLANDGGEVALFSPQEMLIDVAAFPKSTPGKSYARMGEVWSVGVVATPGRFTLASEVFVPEEPVKKVLGTKIKKVAAKPKVTKVAMAPIRIAFNETEDLVSGRPVIARGIVSAAPGVLGKQYFYLSSAEGGMQIYQSKKDFPPLAVGDAVEVRGKISVAGGVKRINIPNKAAVDILDTAQGLEPQTLELDDLGEENTGELVTVSGEITEITGSQLYADDGNGEIAVYIHASTPINKKDFKVRQLVKVTGILEDTAKGWRISPRSPDDLVITGTSNPPPQAVLGEKIEKNTATTKYLVTGLVGLGAVVAVGLWKFYGAREKV